MNRQIVYENLRIEMARKGLYIKDISEATHINRNTLSRKFSGKSKLYLHEAIEIQKACFSDCELAVLFEELTPEKCERSDG